MVDRIQDVMLHSRRTIRYPLGGVRQMTENQTTAWIVVKQWPGGRIEPIKVFLDEEAARYAASRLIGHDGAYIVLWTVPFEG